MSKRTPDRTSLRVLLLAMAVAFLLAVAAFTIHT